MFGKKILILTAGYIAGSVVGSIYKSKKKMPTQLKSKSDAKQLAANFLEIQKNFIDDIEKRFLSENGKEKLDATKKKFHEYAEKYLEEGERLVTELQASDAYAQTKKRGFSILETLRLKKREVQNDVEVEAEKLHAKAKKEAADAVKELKK